MSASSARVSIQVIGEPGENRRIRHLRLTGLLMAGALAGKILGFVREIAFARLLGASMVADGFRSALTGTLLPIAPLQGDAVPAVLIPLHKRWSAEGRAQEWFTSLTVALVLFSLVIAIVVRLAADSWMRLIAGGLVWGDDFKFGCHVGPPGETMCD